MNSVTLRPQPGLEGYELAHESNGNTFHISDGVSLTMEAGTTLMFPENSIVHVYGHLEAKGTLTQPVTFTSAANNGPGDWLSLYIQTTGSGLFKNTIIQYTIEGLRVHSEVEDGQVIIEDSIFRDNLFYPLETSPRSLHQLAITNTLFENNGFDRIKILSGDFSRDTLAQNSVLRPQPGLEGYEIDFQAYPYVGEFKIPLDKTLTLASGTKLMLGEYVEIKVMGNLSTEGTAVNPVTITSAIDTGPEQWDGIVVDGGEATLNNTTVRYGTNNLSLFSLTSTVTISHSQIISASLNGVTIEAGNLNVSCSTLGSSGAHGLWVGSTGTSTVTINQSEIQGNGAAGISNTNTVQVEAANNWWGAADGPGGDGPGSGDAVYGNVLYTPWLSDAPNCPQSNFNIFLPVILKP